MPLLVREWIVMSAPRVAIVIPVRFSSGEHAVQTTTQELSNDGVRVRCQRPPALGSEVQLRLYLPGEHGIAEFGAVVRALISGNESGFWADFVRSAPQSRERIARLLRELPGAVGQASTLSNTEQRATVRHAARFVVRFESVEEFVLQYAANISAGGVFIATERAPELEAIISVALELPGTGEAVVARAQVVHLVTPQQAAQTGREAGVGVQFLDADDAFRSALDRSIDSILAQNSERQE